MRSLPPIGVALGALDGMGFVGARGGIGETVCFARPATPRHYTPQGNVPLSL